MKGKYGLKALVYLAGIDAGRRAQVGEIAEARGIPRKFLESILSELRNAGYVSARKGPQGGYCLARPAVDIIVGKVIRAIDGPLAPIACASRSGYSPCPDCDETTCEIRHIMVKVRMAICDVLDHCTLADLRAHGHLLAMVDEPCS